MEYRRRFRAGDTVFAQGDAGQCAYVVEEGSVDILTRAGDREILLATRQPGELFGEMAIIDDQPRSAGARAVTDCTLLMITRDQLNQRIERTDPILRMCIQVVLRHLRDTLHRLTNDGARLDAGPAEQLSREAREEALHAIRLEQELQGALDQDQLVLWYQPLVDLQQGHVAGFEALMRWRHPERGLVPPFTFIPAAERSGLIVPMTRWAFRRACLDLKDFQEAATHPPTFMSVNFSGKDFMSPDFLDAIDETLAETGTAPQVVKLEITETLLMHSPDTARRVLGACRDRGISIAIDDFGTGYSSLSYLQSLPADTLKIDQSFIRAMLNDDSSHSLVRSIVGLAKGLDMKLVAEGVEGMPEATALRELGVDFGQGYLFAKPLPRADMIEVLRGWQDPF